MALTDAELFAHEVNGEGRLTRAPLLEVLRSGKLGSREALCAHAQRPADAAARAALRARLAGALSASEDRAVGALLGMACGDALGAPLEFMPARAHGMPPSLAGMAQLLPGARARNAFALKPGQWTDDTAMGLCLADSLLACGGAVRPLDLMLRFVAWWHAGYNNAFADDEQRRDRRDTECKCPRMDIAACTCADASALFITLPQARLRKASLVLRAPFFPRRRSSVGLGGTISASLSAFERDGEPLTRSGDSSASGNGSIMRLAPVAACFWRDERAAAAAARLQSRTTHAGEEAAECSALLATVMARGIASAGALTPRQVLEALVADGFDTPCASVACLARAQTEPGGNPDRDWRWQARLLFLLSCSLACVELVSERLSSFPQRPEHEFSPSRAAMQPGYVGSYAMDAAAMALHCVWSTDSAAAALLLAANHRGDADSVAAVTGALAGALYGASALPADWVAAVQCWDGGGGIAERALRLHDCHANAGQAAQQSA